MRVNYLYLMTLVIVVCAFSGCKSSKNVSKGGHGYTTELHGGNDYESLSEKLKIQVSKSDDILLFNRSAEWLGVPYKYGGNTKKGVDCSGLVVNIFEDVYGKRLYRNSAQIVENNCKKISKNELRTGDLVFFATGSSKKRINHVGIYLKDGKFIHSSSSKGVIVSDMDEAYYVRTYVCSGRVI